MPKTFTAAEQDKFIELRAQGHSFNDIAEQLGISKNTLIDWSKDFAVDIENRKALEREALQTKYLMTWNTRIEAFGEMLERIDQELEERDFSDVTTKELMELKIKYMDKLKSEQQKIIFKRKTDEHPFMKGFGEYTEEWEA
jgi:transposase